MWLFWKIRLISAPDWNWQSSIYCLYSGLYSRKCPALQVWGRHSISAALAGSLCLLVASLSKYARWSVWQVLLSCLRINPSSASDQAALPSIFSSQAATGKKLPWSLLCSPIYFLSKASSHSHWLPCSEVWMHWLYPAMSWQTPCSHLSFRGSVPSQYCQVGQLFPSLCATRGSMSESRERPHRSISLLIKQESRGVEGLVTLRSILTVGTQTRKHYTLFCCNWK